MGPARCSHYHRCSLTCAYTFLMNCNASHIRSGGRRWHAHCVEAWLAIRCYSECVKCQVCRSIMQVRYDKDVIDMDIMSEVIDKMRIGLPTPPLPMSDAKRRLAQQFAGRAIVAALCTSEGFRCAFKFTLCL